MTTTVYTNHREYLYELAVDFDAKVVVAIVRYRTHLPNSRGESITFPELDAETQDHMIPVLRKAYKEYESQQDRP